MNAAIFSQQIKMARTSLNWTIRELAEKAALSPDTVIKAEKGNQSVKPSSWGAIQNILENSGIEFLENGAVLLHPAIIEAGVAVSPNMPLSVRRIYPVVSVIYMVTTSDQSNPRLYSDSNKAQEAVRLFLGQSERFDSNFKIEDGKPKYITYKRIGADATATITYLRCDLPEQLKAILENEAMKSNT